MKGFKLDTGKPEYHHIPPEALEAVAEVFAFGARKYSDYNYRQGMDHSRIFNALMRHMWAYWRGEDTDADSQKSHLAHAGCCILMLLQYKIENVGKDNRYLTDNKNKIK